MANCQNNMRYGRQMNFNNGCNATPAGNSNNSGCRNMPINNNTECRNMPSRGSQTGCPAPMPKADCQHRTSEPCGCPKPQPRNNDCMSKPRNTMEARIPECQMPKRRTPEPCQCRYDALEDFPLAMAYVPWQRWQNIFEPCKALQCGTIFEELRKPFRGKGGCNR